LLFAGPAKHACGIHAARRSEERSQCFSCPHRGCETSMNPTNILPTTHLLSPQLTWTSTPCRERWLSHPGHSRARAKEQREPGLLPLLGSRETIPPVACRRGALNTRPKIRAPKEVPRVGKQSTSQLRPGMVQAPSGAAGVAEPQSISLWSPSPRASPCGPQALEHPSVLPKHRSIPLCSPSPGACPCGPQAPEHPPVVPKPWSIPLRSPSPGASPCGPQALEHPSVLTQPWSISLWSPSPRASPCGPQALEHPPVLTQPWSIPLHSPSPRVSLCAPQAPHCAPQAPLCTPLAPEHPSVLPKPPSVLPKPPSALPEPRSIPLRSPSPGTSLVLLAVRRRRRRRRSSEVDPAGTVGPGGFEGASPCHLLTVPCSWCGPLPVEAYTEE